MTGSVHLPAGLETVIDYSRPRFLLRMLVRQLVRQERIHVLI